MVGFLNFNVDSRIISELQCRCIVLLQDLCLPVRCDCGMHTEPRSWTRKLGRKGLGARVRAQGPARAWAKAPGAKARAGPKVSPSRHAASLRSAVYKDNQNTEREREREREPSILVYVDRSEGLHLQDVYIYTCIYTYSIYIDIFTSVNPCMSMLRVKHSRVKRNRLQIHRTHIL